MNKSLFKVFSLITILALMLAAVPMQSASAAGTVTLTTLGSPYTQDFNTLASTGTSSVVPTGWALFETGTNANTFYTAGTGSNNAGDTYSFGAASNTERAFGGLLSGSLVPLIGAQFTNNTGGMITSLSIAYAGEQWRVGVTNRNAADRLDFQLSTNATSLNTGTWTDHDSLDFSGPIINATLGALDGNATANRTPLSFTITGLSIANGSNFWIRWADFNISNSDDGLSVDDFALTPNGVAADATPSVSSTNPTGGATNVILTSNIDVTFSEPVNVTGNWFQLVCPSATYNVANTVVTGGPTTFTIDPNTDLANSETCTLTVFALQVEDQDANDPPGNMAADYIASFTTIGPDAAPTVASTVPADNATNVAVSSNITVNFSETVNVSGSWFTLSCAVSGSHAATVTGGPTSFVVNPSSDFSPGELCTFTVLAAQVSDQDSNDPPNNISFDFIVDFTTFDACAQTFTPIYNIQGIGLAAAITGTVTTKGVVVGDFEGTAAASGFYIQDLTGDGDPATSDGIFVFTGATNLVNIGQVVYVTGFARERFNQTTLNGSNSNTSAVPAANIVQCGTSSVTPTDVTLPVTSINDFERYEGMSVRFPQPLVIAEYFNYDRFGEIVLAQPLAGETRPFNGTSIDEPGAAANARTLANSLSRITLDDAQSTQNPGSPNLGALRHPNGLPFSLANKFRGGDTVQNAIGVLGYDFNLYRIIPTGPADYTAVNPRPAAPEPVGGNVRVAAMNTLNFFVTANYPTGNPLDNKCGPSNNVECRGWDSNQTDEFTRQRDKLLTALSGLDADIIGLNELENSTGVDPLVSITSGLPGYAYIDTGTIGTDAIKVGLIYRPVAVTPVGDFKLLTSAVDPRFIDTKSRPSLAQTFEVNATGARFTVVVNHLKSKGSACTDVGDPDLLDGQGNCSQTRRAAAEALVDWLATDPTGSGDPDFMIMGDLNAYAQEDTIDEIKAGSDDTVGTNDDFTNLISHFHGAFAYSYTFDGQAGYLDHALASASMMSQITGAADWHINSDEPDVLDYDTSFKPAAQDALYEVNPYRTSDHDPVVVGLIPNAPPTVDAGGPYSVDEGGSVSVTASGSDPNGDSLTYAWDLDNDGSFETPGQTALFSAASLDGPSSYFIKVKATDPGGLFAVSTGKVNVLNVAPTITSVTNNGPINEGSSATISVNATDPAGANDPLSYEFDCNNDLTYEVGPQSSDSASCSFGDNGSYIVGVRVSDGDSGTATGSTTVEVNNVAPTVNASFASSSISCGPNNSTLNVSFTDPAAADTHSAVINWGDGNTQTVSPATSPFSLQHTYALAGTYTATVTVTDDDGGVGTTTATVTVNFNTSGFLPPINTDGTSVFKYNSTIPVKIRFTNCDGSIPANLAPTIKLTMISGSTPGLEINEPLSTSAADTTGVMRFSTNQYIYNLATKPLPDPSATYLITVTIPYNGQTVTVQFGLKP